LFQFFIYGTLHRKASFEKINENKAKPFMKVQNKKTKQNKLASFQNSKNFSLKLITFYANKKQNKTELPFRKHENNQTKH